MQRSGDGGVSGGGGGGRSQRLILGRIGTRSVRRVSPNVLEINFSQPTAELDITKTS